MRLSLALDATDADLNVTMTTEDSQVTELLPIKLLGIELFASYMEGNRMKCYPMVGRDLKVKRSGRWPRT